jgi:hypothetical protein
MHALFLRNLTINPLILKVFALTKVGETSGDGVWWGMADLLYDVRYLAGYWRCVRSTYEWTS